LRRLCKYFLNQQVLSIVNKLERDDVKRCWCGGELKDFKWDKYYGVCVICGTYVNRFPPKESLESIFSFDFYWHKWTKFKGHPDIEKRTELDKRDGRINVWLEIIEKYGPKSGKVIEVGCAHGSLLQELKKRGYDCSGVEIDPKTSEWTRGNTGIEMYSGVFPFVDLPKCDMFLALDVLLHSREPEAFIKGISNILNPNGMALIQTPIDRYDFEPPFGEKFESAFDNIHHYYLFTNHAMEELAKRSELVVVSLSERWTLHHEYAIFRKNK